MCSQSRESKMQVIRCWTGFICSFLVLYRQGAALMEPAVRARPGAMIEMKEAQREQLYIQRCHVEVSQLQLRKSYYLGIRFRPTPVILDYVYLIAST